jgi:hypothetical protein
MTGLDGAFDLHSTRASALSMGQSAGLGA